MHYYQHSIGDYRRDTMHLTLLEHGVYRQLLDLYYLNECELNANALRLICARSADEVQAAESVLHEFFVKTENGYSHKRCDAEIAKYQDKSAKAKASADARWKGDNAKPMRTHSDGNADGMLTNNHKPLTNNHIKDIRGSRLTNDWEAPQDYIDFCVKERPDLDANMIANIFRDYWIGVAGAKGVKNDWFATWRNWVRRQEQGKSKFKNKSAVMSDSQFDDWLNSATTEVQHERLA